MENNNKTVIILCYGLFEESNLQYKKYLDKAIDSLNELSPSKIIVCGGFTNKNSQQSESSTVSNYLVKVNPEFSKRIILEERSITTPQNLEFAASILNTGQTSSINIICDSIRAPKVYYLSLNYFNSFFDTKVTEEEIYKTLLIQAVTKKIDVTKDLILTHEKLMIKGIWIERTISEVGDQIIATIEEIGGYNYKSIEEQILSFKRKQFEIE